MKFNNALLYNHIMQKRRDLELTETNIISLKKIADRIGIRDYTLNRTMNTGDMPSVGTLYLICKFLGTKMEDYIIMEESE